MPTEPEIRCDKAFWAFSGIASPDCSGFKNQSHILGVAHSTYVLSPFRNTNRVGGGVELKKTAVFVLIRAEIGPTKNGSFFHFDPTADSVSVSE